MKPIFLLFICPLSSPFSIPFYRPPPDAQSAKQLNKYNRYKPARTIFFRRFPPLTSTDIRPKSYTISFYLFNLKVRSILLYKTFNLNRLPQTKAEGKVVLLTTKVSRHRPNPAFGQPRFRLCPARHGPRSRAGTGTSGQLVVAGRAMVTTIVVGLVLWLVVFRRE